MSYRIVAAAAVVVVDIEQQSVVEKQIDDAVQVLQHTDDVDDD